MKKNWLALMMLLLAFSCSRIGDNKPNKYSKLLYVPQNAYDVKYAKIYQHDEVFYDLRVDYPATQFISGIDNYFKSNGYEPLTFDWLNPDIPSSYVRGWSDWVDSRKEPPVRVFQWMTQWKNISNEYMAVVIRYKHVEGKRAKLNVARIGVVYFPDNTAKGLIEWSRKELLKKKNAP